MHYSLVFHLQKLHKKIFIYTANKQFEGYITAKSVTDIYYLTHRLTHSDAETRKIISKLFTLFHLLDTTSLDCRKAISSGISDYEDAINTSNPLRIEYSLRDDKFRLISICNHLVTTTNIAGIEECKVLEAFDETGRKAKLRERKKVELILKDEREALQRFMIQFSIYEKITQKIGEDLYQCVLSYEAEDETDILIRILSFGPNIKVTGPEDFVKNIRRRLESQRDMPGSKASE